MTKVEYGVNCDLCGLPVKIEGFTLVTDNHVFRFCCAGCQSIYQLIYLNQRDLKSVQDSESSQTNNNSNEEK